MNIKLFLSASAVTLVQLLIFYVLVTETSLIFKIMATIPVLCICYVWYHAGKAVGRSEQIETERKLNKLMNE